MRHFFSQCMSKIEYGFDLNLGNCGRTLFFNGQENHLVPSASQSLIDSDLFQLEVNESMIFASPGISHFSIVIGRRERQMQQIRKGLKDTGVLQLLKVRPDTLDVLFPRASSKFIQSQMILDKIIWPSPDSDDDDSLDLESSCRLTGFIRQYIENGNGESLTELIKFWVGWPILPLNLEVTHANGTYVL
ncbi:hypothetical protein SKAU_G00352250 [Synaphobranchus kaupii]|uniref:Uncharacterized protein n=1 Tax=Synaphobranchus kaupii TaxID=118154 RepID=A0A9Q1II22_SYNKA|nr:hypothetical protein SKAU_G00352250 [Synaphobranchus kaupii]